MRWKGTMLALIMLAGTLVACSDTEKDTAENEETTVTPVEVVDVKTGDFKVKKSVYGRTEPSKQSPVMIQEPGEIKEILVSNGDQVDEDDHLATLKTPTGDQEIKAPKSGEVAKLDAEEGDMQTDEDPLLIVMDTDDLHATFALSSSTQKLFKKDDTATIYIEDEKYKGDVLSVDSLPNDSGQYEMKIKIENKEDVLPGTAAKLEVSETRVKDTIIVPTDAIVTETDDTFVFIAEDDEAKKVKVDVEETQTENSAVKGDLEKGDQVIMKGQSTLSDGAEISVKEGNEE